MLNLKKLVEKYNVFLFDLDNTLFNYTIANDIAMDKVMEHFGIDKSVYLQSRINIKKRDLQVNHHKKELYFKNICEILNLPISTALKMYNLYSKEFAENLLADKTMMDFVKSIKEKNGKIIAITNYYVIPQLEKLETSGFIDYIDNLVTSEEFEVEKPNVKLLEYALELAGNPDKSEVVMLGDSICDNLSVFDIDYYPYNCSKLLISISGKSGVGKTTMTEKIKDIWDATVIEGDGYHKYERDHKAWNSITHYNPEGNNLLQMSLDIRNIYHNIGKVEIPVYSHDNGTFGDPKIINKDIDVTIIEGLHTLYPEVTGDYVKIKIFIDSVNADKQKITRDVNERNKSEQSVLKSIQHRSVDYDKYIAIQKKHSNFLIEVGEHEFIISLSGELCYNKKEVFTGPNDKLFDTVETIMNNFKLNRYINAK